MYLRVKESTQSGQTIGMRWQNSRNSCEIVARFLYVILHRLQKPTLILPIVFLSTLNQIKPDWGSQNQLFHRSMSQRFA